MHITTLSQWPFSQSYGTLTLNSTSTDATNWYDPSTLRASHRFQWFSTLRPAKRRHLKPHPNSPCITLVSRINALNYRLPKKRSILQYKIITKRRIHRRFQIKNNWVVHNFYSFEFANGRKTQDRDSTARIKLPDRFNNLLQTYIELPPSWQPLKKIPKVENPRLRKRGRHNVARAVNRHFFPH